MALTIEEREMDLWRNTYDRTPVGLDAKTAADEAVIAFRAMFGLDGEAVRCAWEKLSLEQKKMSRLAAYDYREGFYR